MKNFVDHSQRFGYPSNGIHPDVLRRIRTIIPFNLNNYGMHVHRDDSSLHSISENRIRENKVIGKILKWLNFKYSDIGLGYVTTGSTEGLIWGHWAARKYSEKHDLKPISIIGEFSHPCIHKAASVTNIETLYINDKISSSVLRARLGPADERFLPILNLNWLNPILGESDEIEESIQFIKESYPESVIILDGAFGGLINPICYERNLYNLDVDIFVMDFHKGGMAPVGTGLVLYNPKFQQALTLRSSYLPYGEDNTLIGSRNFMNVVAIEECARLIEEGWFSLQYDRLRNASQKVLDSCRVVKKFFPIYFLDVGKWPLDARIENDLALFDIYPTRSGERGIIRIILNPSISDQAIDDLILLLEKVDS